MPGKPKHDMLPSFNQKQGNMSHNTSTIKLEMEHEDVVTTDKPLPAKAVSFEVSVLFQYARKVSFPMIAKPYSP